MFKKISVNTLADHKQKEDFSDYISQRIETSAKSSLVKSLNVLEPQFIATETDPEAWKNLDFQSHTIKMF